jgi:hypothetical protein
MLTVTYGKCHINYAGCLMLSVIMLSVVVLSQKVNKITYLTSKNMAKPKEGAKHELLLHKAASALPANKTKN